MLIRMFQTTQAQVAEARDALVVRAALQRWRHIAVSRLELERRVAVIADSRKLRLAFALWSSKLAERRTLAWRADMRQRMKSVRERREAEILKSAWQTWRSALKRRDADLHYRAQVLKRALEKWRDELRKVETLEDKAIEVAVAREDRNVDRVWERWRMALTMRRKEVVLAERVGHGAVRRAMQVWKLRT
jgi:protein SFI1